MKKTRRCIFFVDSRPESEVDYELNWIDFARAHVLCIGCSRVSVSYIGTPIDLVVQKPPKRKLIVSGRYSVIGHRPPPIYVVHRGFIDQVRKHLKNHIIGNVLLARDSGRHPVVVEDYVTCYPRREDELPIHNGPKCEYRLCHACGQVIAGAQWTEPEHTLARYLGNKQLFQDGCRLFYITQELRESLDWSMFPDARFYKLPVLDEPLDLLTRPQETLP